MTSCDTFDRETERLARRIGPFEPAGLVSLKLESPDHWEAVAHFVEAVLEGKELAERQRQSLDVAGAVGRRSAVARTPAGGR